MVVVNPQLISRDMSYGKLTKAEQKILKSDFGRLWELYLRIKDQNQLLKV